MQMQVQELMLLCVDTWPASLDHRARPVSPSSRALSNLNELLRISWQDFIRSDLLLDSQACTSKKKTYSAVQLHAIFIPHIVLRRTMHVAIERARECMS